jgi:hypothetical protein
VGFNDRMDEWFATEVPPAAIASESWETLEIDDKWLAAADEGDQIEAMKAWFLARFCDPANDTPYNGAEGGYQFIHGGPYDPDDELQARFSGIASDEAIAALVEELYAQVGDNWAPINWGREDEYDEDYDIELTAADEPLKKLYQRIVEIHGLMGLTGTEDAQKLAERMAHTAAIAALESFLYETMLYWIEFDEATVKNIVTRIPEFKETEIKLSEIYNKLESLKTDIKGYLQNIVWHNWKKVMPLVRDGLGIKVPSVKQFEQALGKRHDIVHRSGHTKDGQEVLVTKAEITELCQQISDFASSINQAIAGRRTGEADF